MMKVGKKDEAVKAFVEAKRLSPEQAEVMDQLIARAKSPAAVAPPSAEHPVQRAKKAPLRGVIKLGEGVTLEPGLTLFIVVRAAGVTRGRPLAAKRVVTGVFPMSFRLTEANLLGGGAIPEEVMISVRSDKDGDASTKDADAKTASQDKVRWGESLLRLELR